MEEVAHVTAEDARRTEAALKESVWMVGRSKREYVMSKE